jgi:hypothetical protein
VYSSDEQRGLRHPEPALRFGARDGAVIERPDLACGKHRGRNGRFPEPRREAASTFETTYIQMA